MALQLPSFFAKNSNGIFSKIFRFQLLNISISTIDPYVKKYLNPGLNWNLNKNVTQTLTGSSNNEICFKNN